MESPVCLCVETRDTMVFLIDARASEHVTADSHSWANRSFCARLPDGDAEALANRGLRLVEDLDGEQKVQAALELLHIQFSARVPDPEEVSPRVHALTEEAMDLGLTPSARLGFQMLSYMRWEVGSMAAAHDNIMRAERLSRSAEPKERATALSQAAKCLLLLERDLSLAESFVMEAAALESRGAPTPSAMRFAQGMLQEHRGQLDAAADSYDVARQLGREHGDRLAEYDAIEHRVMLELDRGQCQKAFELAGGLADLGGKVRAGAESACSRALLLLAMRACGKAYDEKALVDAVADLRTADSKYRLAFVLTRLAGLEQRDKNPEAARTVAVDGLRVAEEISRASEMALAHVTLASCAADDEVRAEHFEALKTLQSQDLSAKARSALEAELGDALGFRRRER